MKKFIKITAVVGVIIVVLGIVCIVAGISKGGSNIVKEEIGKTFAKAKVKIEKNDTTGMTKLENNSDTIDMVSVNNLKLDLFTITLELISQISSTTTRPFSFNVVPVSIMSTIPSLIPSIGASSTDPSIFMISTSIPLPSK